MTIILDKEVTISIIKIDKHYRWLYIFDKEMFDDVCEVQVSLLNARSALDWWPKKTDFCKCETIGYPI